jgi:hypothetical protein
MVASPLKLLYRDPLPYVIVDDIEDDKMIGGHTAYKARFKDYSFGYDVTSSDDHDSNNDGSKCIHEKLRDVRMVKNKKMLAPINVAATTL